jgi:hypothetical protein
LTEEGNLDRLADFDFLALLHKYLSRELATILSIEGGNPVSFGVVALLERL